MKSELGTAGAAVGAFALICLFGGVVLAVYPGWQPIGAWFENDGAGKTQAVCAFVGILIAIAVPYAQRAHEIADRRRVEMGGAQVAGASVLLKLNPVIGGLMAMRDFIRDEAVHPHDFLAPLQSQLWPTEQELLLITAAMPETAVRLARGRMLVEQAKIAFEMLTQQSGISAALYRRRLAYIDELIAHALGQYQSASNDLNEVIT